jgi:hypothetical protein
MRWHGLSVIEEINLENNLVIGPSMLVPGLETVRDGAFAVVNSRLGNGVSTRPQNSFPPQENRESKT